MQRTSKAFILVAESHSGILRSPTENIVNTQNGNEKVCFINTKKCFLKRADTEFIKARYIGQYIDC